MLRVWFCRCLLRLREIGLLLCALLLVVLPTILRAQTVDVTPIGPDEQQFIERADTVRLPASSMLTEIPNYPGGNPLLPTEAEFLLAPERLAQLPDRPSWATQNVAPTIQPQGRQIRVRPKGVGAINFRMIRRGNENVIVVPTPVQITIFDESGPVELSADRIVVWADENVFGLDNLGDSLAPVEIYLEGNIEFRQARTRGLAERMYYNVAEQNGVILEGELFGEVSQRNRNGLEDFRTPFRLKGQVLQQLSPTRFQANNAAFTTSQLGVPQYWIESETLTLDTGNTSLLDSFRNAQSGSGPTMPDTLRVSSENTQLFVGGVPIFRWPSFSTDLASNPSLYLDRISVGSDSVFGTQVMTRWNNFQLFGITPRPNTRWTTNVDWLSERGLGFGTDLDFQRDDFFGIPASNVGYFHSWFINDNGLDNLGFDRRDVPLEEGFRDRIRWQQRIRTVDNLEITGEFGHLSDRNMQEQYYEREWDQEKDQETRLEIKQYNGGSSLSVSGSAQVNDFFTQTEWLPRLDHYDLGRSLFGDRFTLYGHSQVGYGRLRPGDAPTNPIDSMKFDPLAWEVAAQGVRAVTRQEIDLPLQLGAFKVVPYALGEAAHWQEDLEQNDVTRLLGQAGVRASVPFWRADPSIRNELFNLNGIAHKLVLESDFFLADASEDYLNLPLYDPLDDDAVEFFRRRFLFDTFGLGMGDNVPLKFDERTFAFRSGMQRYVTAPSTEIADDLMMLNLRLRQRIQTKRGAAGQERTVDWFTFDVEGSFFPRADRDNFGQEIGPLQYDTKWFIGDRTSILSDGYFDFFGDGLRTISLGMALSRPGQSEYYLGVRSIEGPISSNVLTGRLKNRLSEKWILDYGGTVDFGSTGNIGHSARIIRIGESVLVGLGAYYDASRDNLGFRFYIWPRFVPSRDATIGGRPIPPVNSLGLD